MDARLLQPATWLPHLEKLRTDLPERAVSHRFSGTFGRQSYGGGEYYRTADGEEFQERGDGRHTAMDVLRALSDLAPAGEAGVTIAVDRNGPSRVVLYDPPDGVSTGGLGAPIGSVVLRPGTVPAPYRRLPEPHRSAWDAGMDPAWLAGVVRQALPDASGLSDEQLREWEQRSRCVLPPDVRALYRTAAGGDLVLGGSSAENDDDEDAAYVMRILPLGEQDPHWTPQARFLGWEFGATEVVAPDPAGRVQPLAFSPAWVPIGDDWGGNLYVCDLAPGPRGTIGQLLFVDHETLSGATWVASSLTAFVKQRTPDVPGPAGAPESLKVRIGTHTRQSLADVTPDTEVLIVNRVDQPVDLTPLAGHPRLRTLEIAPGPVTGVQTLHRLPALEYLATNLATWRFLIDRNLVPERLLAAGFRDADADWPETVGVANHLLARWGRPPIAEHVVL